MSLFIAKAADFDENREYLRIQFNIREDYQRTRQSEFGITQSGVILLKYTDTVLVINGG